MPAKVVVVGPSSKVIQSLLSSGFEVVLMHEAEHAVMLDRFKDSKLKGTTISSYRSVESVASTLAVIGVDQIVGVIPGNEAAVVATSFAAAGYGLRSIPPATAVLCRDKSLQKQSWNAAGVQTARWERLDPCTVRTVSAVGSILEGAGIGFPCVLKPLFEAGSVGVVVAKGVEDVLAYVLESPGPLLAEEKLDLDEWHLDGVVRDGSISHLTVSRYVEPLLTVKTGRPVRSYVVPHSESASYGDALSFSNAAISPLLLTDGVFHLEVFGAPGDFVAGELACRPGGGLIVDAVETATGIDLWAEHWKAILGEAMGATPRFAAGATGFIHLPTVGGRINHIDPNVFSKWKGVKQVVPRCPRGEVMPDMSESSGASIAYVLMAADDVPTLLSGFESITERTEQLFRQAPLE